MCPWRRLLLSYVHLLFGSTVTYFEGKACDSAAAAKQDSPHPLRVMRARAGDPPAPQSSIAAATKRRLAGGDRRTACPTKKSSRRARRPRSCNTADGRNTRPYLRKYNLYNLSAVDASRKEVPAT